MKLVTFQSLDAVRYLFQKEYLECDSSKVDTKKVGRAYQWIVEEMNQKMDSSKHAKYPLWCWVKCYQGIFPPKRKGKRVAGFDVKITFHKNEQDVFITDFRRYSFLLNNCYIPTSKKDKEQFDLLLKEKNITLEELQAYVRLDKYDRCRNDSEFIEVCNTIHNSFKRCITNNSDILQGCVWRINLEDVEKIEFLPDDGNIYGSLNYIRSDGKRMDWVNDFYHKLK